MDRLTGECNFFNLERVNFGPGKVSALGAELDRVGGERAIIATGNTLAASPLLEKVVDAMGPRYVGVFKDTAQHGPVSSAEALAAEMRRLGADSIVSFGGGSAIDTAKVAVAAVITGRPVAQLAAKELLVYTDLGTDPRDIPHITLPTTLSAGEFTCGGGVTDANGQKASVMHPRLEIRTVIYDPDLSVATNAPLWLSTGVRALDHVIEAFYSQHSQSFTDALAAKALDLFLAHLPGSAGPVADAWLSHRGYCQQAAWLSNYAAINTRYGLSHAVGHKIGSKWSIPHGVTSCIALPSSMRFMAARAPARFEMLAKALHMDFDLQAPEAGAMACADTIDAFIAGLGMPRTLSDFGVTRSQFGDVVNDILQEVALFDAVGFKVSEREIESLLETMLGEPEKVLEGAA